jgi:hypothetical protein
VQLLLLLLLLVEVVAEVVDSGTVVVGVEVVGAQNHGAPTAVVASGTARHTAMRLLLKVTAAERVMVVVLEERVGAATVVGAAMVAAME